MILADFAEASARFAEFRVVVLNGAVCAVNNVGSARINCAIQPDVETKLLAEIGSNILFENTSGLILPKQQGDPCNCGYLNTNFLLFFPN